MDRTSAIGSSGEYPQSGGVRFPSLFLRQSKKCRREGICKCLPLQRACRLNGMATAGEIHVLHMYAVLQLINLALFFFILLFYSFDFYFSIIFTSFLSSLSYIRKAYRNSKILVY